MFGQRVAHGLLVLSIAIGLAVRLGFMEETIAAFRGLAWKFVKPVFIGDTVHLRVSVAEKRAMQRLGGGLVTFRVEVVNQAGEVCQRGDWEILCKGQDQV
jgi:acyl dehydratase